MSRKKKEREAVRLDFNPSGDPVPGFKAHKFDPLHLPWSFKSASIDEIWYHYGFQRVPGKLRGRFMEELYRVLVPEGKAMLIVPYYTSQRAVMDYNYEWPPVCEASFLYFNKGWREQNRVPHLECDFDFGSGANWEPDVQSRTPEVQQNWLKRYNNVALDLQVVLTKTKRKTDV